MSIKFLVLGRGGGGWGFGGGGGSADFIFMGARIFLKKWGQTNGPLFGRVCVFDVSRAARIARSESVSESQPHRTIECH